MPKRKRSFDKRRQRERDRDRKRQERQKPAARDPSLDETPTEHGAVLAPPGNFPGRGSMGFPPKEEKPLARVQASPRVKMHSPAPRLPSPWGSRLFVHNEDKAPSPDSPPWVCAPLRAPGSDMGYMSGPAGQAQLDTSREEETSRISKDEGTLTNIKRKTERISKENLNEYNSESERKTNRNENEKNEKYTVSENNGEENTKKRNSDQCFQMSSKGGYYNISNSIQGSFHQAHPMFEENAGTQCVANCLAGLAYHKLKNAKNWKTTDMDRILLTGDELYTYLQRCSSINDRYLLVDELPQHFECFNRSYEFQASETYTSVVIADDSLNYADFNALPLIDALRVALTDTDGCFVCFGGNTMLIGLTESGYFAFDSHSRSSDGMLSVTGKSTRVLLQSVHELFSHLQDLALSMGYSKDVECNLSGVTCKMHMANDLLDGLLENEDIGKISGISDLSSEIVAETGDKDDELILISHEQSQFSFMPLSTNLKMHLCQNLNIPFICIDNASDRQCFETTISEPMFEREILGDGNCFFRAVSYSLTNSEDFHNVMRNLVCEHMIENKELFQSFLKDGVQSVENHLLSTGMSREGTWATEVEIFVMVHLLNIDIYTYSEERWLRFSVDEVEPSMQSRNGAIYLNHQQQNHYNVVLSVEGEESDLTQLQQSKNRHEYKKRYQNRTRMQEKRQSTSNIQGKLSAAEKRKQSLRKRYHEDEQFKEKKLKVASIRYATDDDFKRNVKKKSIDKYAMDDDHKEDVKKRSTARYSTDYDHREDVKKRSIEKYAMDDGHREVVKAKSKLRYKSDEMHRNLVNAASTKRYKENEIFRETKLQAAAEKYESDESFRSNIKATSKKRYVSSAIIKAQKKERVKSQRIAQRGRMKKSGRGSKSIQRKGSAWN